MFISTKIVTILLRINKSIKSIQFSQYSKHNLMIKKIFWSNQGSVQSVYKNYEGYKDYNTIKVKMI